MTNPSNRVADHDVLTQFTERWSPRSFTDEAVSDADLARLFEAARWAPSAFNSQPWRFVYARKDTPYWPLFVDLLMPFNRIWAERAGALVYLLSSPTYVVEGKPEPQTTTHSAFDCGTAWGFLALQAHSMGLVAHGMAGIFNDRIVAELGAPGGLRAEIAIAIGHQGPTESLPEKLQPREVPSQRHPIGTFAFEGKFPEA